MSGVVADIAERIIGGVAAPIVIVVVSVWLGVTHHGYLPVWMAPMVLVISWIGTAQFRRPTVSRAR